MNRFRWVLVWTTGSLTFAAANPLPLPTINYSQVPLSEILGDYEVVSGKKVSCPKAIAQVPLTIEVLDPTPYLQSAAAWTQFISHTLLLNGFHLTKNGDGSMAVVHLGQPPKTNPYVLPEYLPDSNEVVQYLMCFNYIAAAEAAQIFQPVMAGNDGSSYGRIDELGCANALLITEKASIIKQLVALQEKIDCVLIGNPTKVVQINGHDVKAVAEAVNKLTRHWTTQITVYPDKRTNRLVVIATKDDIKTIGEFLANQYGVESLR